MPVFVTTVIWTKKCTKIAPKTVFQIAVIEDGIAVHF